MNHTLVARVEDHPGVLNRVASLFRRRAFNIRSLTVGGSEMPDYSRMTIVVDTAQTPAHLVESNLRKLAIAVALGAPVFVLYLRAHPESLLEVAGDYVSFIVLLGGLFVISGGVFLEGDLEATPRTNAAFLGAGALLASFVGTTGASMLLIRPLLQTNRERKQ